MTFKWSVGDVSMLKWMESDTVPHSALWKQILSLMCHSQTSKRRSVAPQQHSQLWPFNMLRLGFIPLHLLLSQKMLTNLSNHFCNMLHHSTACHTICHVSLRSVNIYLLKLDCSASTYFCRIVHSRTLWWLSSWGLEICGTVQSPAVSCWWCLLFGDKLLWNLTDSYLSTWSKFPDTPSPPMV